MLTQDSTAAINKITQLCWEGHGRRVGKITSNMLRQTFHKNKKRQIKLFVVSMYPESLQSYFIAGNL
jgi:hypothetical protein